MNFIQELEWRGMLFDSTPGVENIIDQKKVLGYIGFDPTAPSMTIGNYVQIMLLNLFQKHGHTPIMLMGGATGRIGDPSGKDKERVLKTEEELDGNLKHQVTQARKLLNFETGDNKAQLVNNYDFYKNMNILDFLRNVGKTLTVNYMMSKESVKKRIETGISFTEFSYQLIQGYDFQCLYEKYDCIIQMGGSDQWGNITSGTEFIRRNAKGKAYAITTPLLTKSDGSKFGKSEGGNIWLDGTMTTPYQFYQFWLNADDADIPKYTRYFTFKTKEEVESMEKEYADDPRTIKRLLAEELTKRIHGEEAFKAVLNVSEIIFNHKLDTATVQDMDETSLASIAMEIKTPAAVQKSLLDSEISVADLLTDHAQIFKSKGDFRRAIKGNALSINKKKITDINTSITLDQFMHEKYLLVENGKKNKFLIDLI